MSEVNIKYLGQSSERFQIDKLRTTIGRSAQSDIIIADPHVSRLHAEIIKENETYWLEDLSSTMGTRCNGQLISKQVQLNSGDEIQIGEATIVFDSKFKDDDRVSGILHIYQNFDLGHGVNKNLSLIANVGVSLLSSSVLEDALNQVVSLVFENIPAERCLIMFRDETNESELIVMIARGRGTEESIEEVRISRTVSDEVMKYGRSVLTSDAQHDPRYASMTMTLLGIRSVVAVPLSVSENEIFGIIYADSPTYNVTFTEEHLNILTTLASVASIRIESTILLDKRLKQEKIKNENENGFTKRFEFPEEIRNSCEQYLLYFAQFLLDLGINVNANLKEESGKVLFSVTPTDETQALDKIREALAIYLNLPMSPIIYDDSFAAMRLQQQIENLQHSQRMAVRELQFNEKLLVAQSDTIREKNLTISQQQSVIEQKDKIIEKISSKSIMIDSAENKEELEELYDGVKVGESETLKKWLGISLNPAKAIKTAVKNTFGKDEKKSVLGLNEEN